MQRLCKSNTMKLASIAEMPPILCKDTFFLSHSQTSWFILTQRLRKARGDNITQMIQMYFLQFDCVISTCEHWQIDFAGDALYLTGKKTGELTKVTAHVII